MRAYHDHDVDFVLYGLTTVGRDADAKTFAKNEDATMQTKVALRLHDDAAVLASAPSSAILSRGIAAARSGEVSLAKRERGAVTRSKNVEDALIDAALAQHAGDAQGRAAAYGRAYDATKDDGGGDPKDFWQDPIGEGYGAALLEAQKPAQAEAVFAAELKRFPNDPHLEFGLAEALSAQHKDDAAARAAYREHWKGSRPLTTADLG
jgi:predicted Zn-dependent protease